VWEASNRGQFSEAGKNKCVSPSSLSRTERSDRRR